MTKYYSNQVAVYFGGYDLGTSTRRYAIGLNAEPLDPTALGDAGERALAGHRKDNFEWDGLFDDTGAADAAGSALIGSGTQNVVMVLIGSATGGVGYACTAVMVAAKPSGKIGELVSQGAEWRMDQAWDRGVHYGLKGTSTNPTPSGTNNNGAASTAGGVAYIMVFSVGSGTHEIFIQHSTSTASFVNLVGTTVSTAGAHRLVIGSGTTINQYTQLGVTTTTGSMVVAAVLKRN